MSFLVCTVIEEMPSAHLVDCVRFDVRLNLAIVKVYAALVCRSCQVSLGERYKSLAHPPCRLGSKAATIWLFRRKR